MVHVDRLLSQGIINKCGKAVASAFNSSSLTDAGKGSSSNEQLPHLECSPSVQRKQMPQLLKKHPDVVLEQKSGDLLASDGSGSVNFSFSSHIDAKISVQQRRIIELALAGISIFFTGKVFWVVALLCMRFWPC